jgi:antitoxin component YwqK of YwqJK toxin-antitoxin module
MVNSAVPEVKKGGTHHKVYKDGCLIEEYNLVYDEVEDDDVVDGEVRGYHSNGQLSTLCYYDKGRLCHGQTRYWDENGELY